MQLNERPGPVVFRAGRFAVLRLAALPVGAADVTRIDPDFEDVDELADGLLGLVADPFIREAIEVASGSLADTISKVEAEQRIGRKKLRRALLSAGRYVLRMSGRPTPFGLYAGVAAVDIGDEVKVRVGEHHHKRVRPDAGWEHAVLVALDRLPEVRDRSTVTVNNLCRVRGDRLVLPYVRRTGPEDDADGPPQRELSVGNGPAVQAVFEVARRPIGYAELRAHLRRTI